MKNIIHFTTLIILFTLSIVAEDNNKNAVLPLVVEKMNIKKVGKNTQLEISLCNKSKSKYFLEYRMLYSVGDRILTGFKIIQNGKRCSYKGWMRKRHPSRFPEDYVLVKPHTCVGYKVMLNDFFDFVQDEEFIVFYSFFNSNPMSKKLDFIRHHVKIQN